MLTAREMQVFNRVASSVGVNDFAKQLGISNKTVSTHKVRLMEKLALNSVGDLIRFSMQHTIKP